MTVYVRLTGILVLGLILEAALPVSWPHPDLCLLLLVPFALRAGRYPGMIFGFFCGVMLALFGSGILGFLGGIYGLVGFLLGIVGEKVNAEYMFMGYVSMILGVFLVGACLWMAGMFLPEWGTPSAFYLRAWVLQSLIINELLLWPSYRLFAMVTGRYAFRRKEVVL